MVSSAALSGAMFNIAPPHLRGVATRGTPRFLRFYTCSLSFSRLILSFSDLLLVQKQPREKGRIEKQRGGGKKGEKEKEGSVYTNQILAPFVRSYSAYGDSKRCPHLRRVVNKFRRTRSRTSGYARDCDKGCCFTLSCMQRGCYPSPKSSTSELKHQIYRRRH